jgi:hypothetical protein
MAFAKLALLFDSWAETTSQLDSMGNVRIQVKDGEVSRTEISSRSQIGSGTEPHSGRYEKVLLDVAMRLKTVEGNL